MSGDPSFPELKYEKHRLANGLDVILLEDHRLPLVAVNIWYHVGPANERPGLTGFAHLFEHMMFEGSKYVGPKEHFRYLEAAGASEINGTTDFDRTNYFETLPSDQLELALWLESDRMGFLLDNLNAETLENQRDVVRNERRQTIENAPYGLVQEGVFHRLFPKGHPYHAFVIGSHADVEAARLHDVRDFFRLYYAPNNASLSIVGDIDPSRTKDLVAKYFGSISPGPPLPRLQVETPPITSERRVIIEDQVELPRLYIAWITDPIYMQGDAECDLLARILGGGKSSRLYKRLVYEKRIAQDISAQQYSLALASIFTIDATAKPGIRPEKVEEAIDQELEDLKRNGPTDEELEGARNMTETALIHGLESLGGFGGVADRLNQYNHFLGDPGYLGRDLARYYRATTGSIREIAQTRLRTSSRVVVYGVPGQKVIEDVPRSGPTPADSDTQSAESEIPNQDWRRTPPSAGPAPSLRLPVPTAFKLANGLTVFLVEQHALPVVSANVTVLAGGERNPVELPGLASFTAEMLDEGTKKRSALQVARDADRLGASLASGCSADLSFVSIRTLRKNIDPALELVSDLLLQPEFPLHEIDRVRNHRLTHILQQKDNPAALAVKTFFHAVYGPNHPYGYAEIGTEASNETTGQEELVRFWSCNYFPSNTALVVCGDISQDELFALAERHLRPWSGQGAGVQLPAAAEHAGRRVIIIDKAGSPQTTLRLGHIGIARANPDYLAISVMNTALGGLFSSRINLNLREAHGYTYGASSAFAYRRGPGPFLVATSVRTDVTAAAVKEIIHEIHRMRETEPTARECAIAKASIARSLPGLFETTSQAASSIGQLFVHSLPCDYYRTLPEQIERVNAADMQGAAQKYLRPEKIVLVAVGDRSKIENDLRSLEFGPVEVRDLDGNPTD